MKKLEFFLSLSVLMGVLSSCTTDVDIYAEYKDIAIVFAMLNPRADTN